MFLETFQLGKIDELMHASQWSRPARNGDGSTWAYRAVGEGLRGRNERVQPGLPTNAWKGKRRDRCADIPKEQSAMEFPAWDRNSNSP
ncbi:hypothetical protein HNR46_003299 [Haloferula luteola]|uniref:Uncharacterized protein n=1 Tax=Haloferula luteola TaxID=595692 RepID=A0A840V7M5_9BACT|nr:hypothetical protein [Haloferula luteola]